MSEGTKIGEYKENTEFRTALKQETVSDNLSATKMGAEVSDLEKELLAEAEKLKTQETPTQQQSQEPVVQQDQNQQNQNKAPQKDVSFDSIFEMEMEKQLLDFQEGEIVKGTVRSIEKSGVLVDFGYKSDGFIPNSELNTDETVTPGTQIQVLIEKLESKEGYALLSRKKAETEASWNEIADIARDRETIKVQVVSQVQGGLVASYKGIKGFIPASQVLKEKDEELDRFINQELDVVIIQTDRRRKKVIFSHKKAQSRLQKAESRRIIDELEVGQVREGKVTSIKDFGVFVDIGGVEGLVHISELSWSRVSHPSDHVDIGDEVKVFVLGIDKANNRISLGMKQLEEDPWVKVAQKYHVGQIVKGKITRLVSFGAFIQIEDELEGLIHISELADRHVEKAEDVVKTGDDVDAKIIKLIPEEQKIGLSLRLAATETVLDHESPEVKERAKEFLEEEQTESQLGYSQD